MANVNDDLIEEAKSEFAAKFGGSLGQVLYIPLKPVKVESRSAGSEIAWQGDSGDGGIPCSDELVLANEKLQDANEPTTVVLCAGAGNFSPGVGELIEIFRLLELENVSRACIFAKNTISEFQINARARLHH